MAQFPWKPGWGEKRRGKAPSLTSNTQENPVYGKVPEAFPETRRRGRINKSWQNEPPPERKVK